MIFALADPTANKRGILGDLLGVDSDLLDTRSRR